MSISETITTAVKETCLPKQCKACERQGLPILVLRKALVPDIAGTSHQKLGDTYPLRTRQGLRTLREGYLYVLLDQKYWQAYEITEQGYLRRFNPYQCTPGSPAPLPARCMHQDHDLPSSFLTVDTAHYSTAWLAFSDDQWTTSVLDAYKDGRAPAQRFHSIDLKAAREDPASIGLAVTHKRQTISNQVFEYAEHDPGVMVSAHPFHSRRSRIHALLRYIETTERQHKLKNGLLAYVLEDPLGMIQESNTQRLTWVARRQEWREDPEVAYPLLTSQCLLAIRAANRTRAENEPPALEQMTGDGPPAFASPEVELQRATDRKEIEYNERLEERYDEKRRAKFQARYEQEDKRYQAQIDFFSTQYALLFDRRDFEDIERHDYDSTDERSRLDYVKTMTLCLRGGITEAPHAQSEPLGPSEKLWLKWLEDPNSPAYRALFVRDKNLLDGLIPSFSATEDTDWKDSVKLYAAVATIINSQEGKLWIRDPLRRSVAELLGAVNAAAARLEYRLGAGVQRAVMHLNVAGQSLHNGVKLVELKLRMTLGEYYAIQSAHVRQLQDTASEALAKVRNVRAPIKVRPIILGGVLSLAALDPRFASKMIDISVWVAGNAEDLHGSLKAGVKDLSGYTKAGLTNIVVAGGILDAQGRQLLNGLRVNASQTAGLLQNSLSGLRGAATSSAVLLGIGGLYLLSDLLKKNLLAVENEVGSKSTESMLALQGVQLAVLGGTLEVIGNALDGGGKRLAASPQLSTAASSRATTVSRVGARIASAGAVMSAGVGMIDAALALAAARRTVRQGDFGATAKYAFSALFSTAGGGYGMHAAYKLSAFLGPLGVAIILGLTAYIIFKAAESEESTPLEMWAKRCYFGSGNETPKIHWTSPDQADIAVAELNAATMGMKVKLGIIQERPNNPPPTSSSPPTYSTTVSARFSMPNFNPEKSTYFWKLTTHRKQDIRGGIMLSGQTVARFGSNADMMSQELFEESHSAVQAIHSGSPTKLTITPIHVQTAEMPDGSFSSIATVSGSVTLKTRKLKDCVEAASLTLTYWPDGESPGSYAQATVVEIDT